MYNEYPKDSIRWTRLKICKSPHFTVEEFKDFLLSRRRKFFCQKANIIHRAYIYIIAYARASVLGKPYGWAGLAKIKDYKNEEVIECSLGFRKYKCKRKPKEVK